MKLTDRGYAVVMVVFIITAVVILNVLDVWFPEIRFTDLRG